MRSQRINWSKTGVVNLLAFGPSLVENGEITVDTNSEVGQSMASNPRTAIGIIDENHYIIVVSDGRTSESEGLSLYQLAEVMKSYGVKTATTWTGVDLLPFTSMAKLLINQQQMVLFQKGR